MLLSIRPICNRKKTRRDGTSIIQIQYCHSAGKKTLLNTGLAIPPNYWTKKSMCISEKLPLSFGSCRGLNEELKRMVRTVEDIVAYAIKSNMPDPVAFAKQTFHPNFDISTLEKPALKPTLEKESANLNLFLQIEDYINSKKTKVTPKMLHVYRNMRDTLKTFELFRAKPITFDSFDYSFYEEFVNYMMYDHVQRRRKVLIKGFRISTIGKTIKQLRIFLRNRMRRKIIPAINLEDFKIIDEESDSIYLTWAEISKIYNADLTGNKRLSRYRDLLVVGCMTGLRFSDLINLRPEDVRNGMLHKKQEKSDHWVVIPLRKEALAILVEKFKENPTPVDNACFNRCIKEIGRIAGIDQIIRSSYKKGNKDIVNTKPKYQMITSHTCRRSFCTNEFLAGTPVDLIMKISGHKSLRDFYRYIRISQEEAGHKIKEIWQGRGEIDLASMQVV